MVAGAGVAGVTMAGSVAAETGNLVSRISTDGHWKLFAGVDVDGESLNFRSKNPFDLEVEKVDPDGDVYDARWASMPAPRGGVRIRAENDPEVGGFDFAAGPLGDIESMTIEGTTEETIQPGGDALLWVGTYMDTQGTGDFFEWARGRGNTETFAGFGDDTECLTHIPLEDGTATIDRGYVWEAVIVPLHVLAANGVDPDDDDNEWFPVLDGGMHLDAGVTWEDYLGGEITVEGVEIELDTGPETEVALPINLRGVSGADEEVIIEDVVVEPA